MKYVTTVSIVAAVLGLAAGYVLAPVITKATGARIPQVHPKVG